MKQKHFLLFIASFLLISCTERSVKNTATDFLKNQMKDPSSFKVDNIEVLLDTIPIFMNNRVLSCAEKVSNAIDEQNRYKDRDSYLWRKEQERASEKVRNAILDLKIEYQTQRKKAHNQQYIVLISSSANNSYGSTISSRYIVIVDKDNTNNVLGEYRLDSDFAQKVAASYLLVGGGSLDTNEYGKIETTGMSKIEKFLFGD
ncbi:MAG: hypothetical protein IKX61_08030 [Prevotella sp.]|nr:hypothetical protein [Prevotella sp.]